MASFVITKNSDGDYIECDSGARLLYVHRNASNFATAAANAYFQKKQENKKAMLNRYQANVMARIHLTPDIKKLFNLSSKEGRERLFSVMDKGVIDGLNNVLSTNTVDQLLELAKSSQAAWENNSIQDIDLLIENISQAASLLDNNNVNVLSVLLNNYLKGNINLSGLSAEISSKLSLTDVEGQIVGFNNGALNTVAKSLLSLISASQKKDDISEKSFQRYLTNIFSTGLGERLIAIGVANQVEKGTDDILDKFLTGTKSAASAPQITYQKGSYQSLKNQTFKADVQAKNFNIKVEEGNNGSFTIDLGMSVKMYSSKSNKVSIVSAKPFNQVMESLFPGGKYYVYNTLGLISDVQDTYREMKKAIVLSYADNFLSGTGHRSDFAQYIVINGKTYPIYDILKDVVENTTGALSRDTDASDPVIISIRGGSKFKDLRYAFGPQNENSLVEAWNRNRAIHSIITGQLTVHGYLNLAKLKKI